MLTQLLACIALLGLIALVLVVLIIALPFVLISWEAAKDKWSASDDDVAR